MKKFLEKNTPSFWNIFRVPEAVMKGSVFSFMGYKPQKKTFNKREEILKLIIRLLIEVK